MTLDLTANPLDVAPQLLGATLEAHGVRVRVTEVEAYLGAADPASHAFKGKSARNATMFLAPGHLYVYFTYGMHYCMNIVCWPEGKAGGCLIRAGEIVGGEELARERRPGVVRSRDLARGPANLTRCLAINREWDGASLCVDGELLVGSGQERIVVVATPDHPAPLQTGPRVGVSGIGGDGGVYPWRFWIPGDPTVSAYKKGGSRK
ncbi:MAG: DNA-3-methyladenine glycosylase [Ancrocorticia sp.]|uniref:DNA-3-methyladenine glycosylase n=1 Tax=Ancrocorticia sp. TaxID=2593684 RepID=UPI003F926CCE